MPAGSPGISCVIFEETGQPAADDIIGRHLCPILFPELGN